MLQTQTELERMRAGGVAMRERILVVDDEDGVRGFLAALLRSGENWEVVEAHDGLEAKSILSREPFDLVITDLSMPEISGLELLQWAKNEGLDAEWIILTGHATMEDAIGAVRLGAFDFVLKPLDNADSLLFHARNALRQRRLNQEKQKLTREVEKRNAQLARQVEQLKDACDLLCRQSEDMAEDLRRAEIIQRALLPSSVPAIRGCSISAIYRPSHNVGGDLYDIVRLDDRFSAVYIADAAGHGVAAAMLAVLLKENLRLSGRAEQPAPPAEVLGLVNRCLLEECRSLGLFVSAAYCLLDGETGKVTIASAGHPPILLQRAGGEFEMIYHTGAALGISGEARYGEKTVVLGPSDRLLLYTDGLFNVPQSASMPTMDQIAGVLADRGRGGEATLRSLLEMAERQRGGSQEDDITLILMSAQPQASSLDNGTPPRNGGQGKLAVPPRAELLVGQDGDSAAVSMQGQGKWTYSPAFLDACRAQIEAGRALTVDLCMCDYLDSTFLGTLQEVADHADRLRVPLRIQGVMPEVRRLIEELGMDRVVGHFAPDVQPLPGRMEPLASSSGQTEWDQLRVLRAHEALASLSEENRRKFNSLIEALRKETK